MADAAPAQRIVPGAPPPPPISKSQKKKRKSTVKPKTADVLSGEPNLVIPDSKVAALIEQAPEEEDIKKGTVAEALVATLEPIPEVAQDKSKKASPAVELLNKRLKVQTKKLSRIAIYSSKPSSELNDDQKKSVASLPAIQGAVRELEETKKAVENLEAEEAKERANQRAEEEKATIDRIAQAVADATNSQQQRLSEILSLLRLSSLLSASDPSTFPLTLLESERHALYVTAETLLGSEGPQKQEAITGLLHAQGDMDGVGYDRLLQLVEAHRNPPVAEREPTPTPEEVAPREEVPEAQAATVVVGIEPQPVVEEVVPAVPHGGFHFMQDSELEGTSFDHGVEWVEKPQEGAEPITVASNVELPEASLSVIDTGIPLGINGVSKHLDEPPLSAVSDALDWAADDGEGLPSINSLHAKFGTSGAATPEALPQDDVPAAEVPTPPAQTEPQWNTAAPAGNDEGEAPTESWSGPALSSPQVDEDGFVKARGSRGRQSDARGDFRGRGRGFRGDRGGEYRGGYRGRGGGDSFGTGWRGGDGEFRGRGGFRGDRGRGGDFRGGEFRGRGGRGGEFRGRGRGERGGHRGGRGGFEGNNEQGERQPQPVQ